MEYRKINVFSLDDDFRIAGDHPDANIHHYHSPGEFRLALLEAKKSGTPIDLIVLDYYLGLRIGPDILEVIELVDEIIPTFGFIFQSSEPSLWRRYLLKEYGEMSEPDFEYRVMTKQTLNFSRVLPRYFDRMERYKVRESEYQMMTKEDSFGNLMVVFLDQNPETRELEITKKIIKAKDLVPEITHEFVSKVDCRTTKRLSLFLKSKSLNVGSICYEHYLNLGYHPTPTKFTYKELEER